MGLKIQLTDSKTIARLKLLYLFPVACICYPFVGYFFGYKYYFNLASQITLSVIRYGKIIIKDEK